MVLRYYHTASGKDLISEYINQLPTNEKVDGYHVLECLEQGKFDSVEVKQWEGKIKEVYFIKHNRIFFIIDEGTTIYVIHACRKQKNKTERRDADIVRKRAKEIFAILKK